MPDTPPTGVRFRPASGADGRRIWEWRNEPDVRAQSFSTDPIPFEHHLAWYARSAQAGRRFYIATTLAGLDIGYVRFDCDGKTAEMSVCLDPAFRHRGLGRIVIADGVQRLLRESAVRTVVALVKEGNDASLAAFRAAGFAMHRRERRGDVDAWVLHFEDTAATGA